MPRPGHLKSTSYTAYTYSTLTSLPSSFSLSGSELIRISRHNSSPSTQDFCKTLSTGRVIRQPPSNQHQLYTIRTIQFGQFAQVPRPEALKKYSFLLCFRSFCAVLWISVKFSRLFTPFLDLPAHLIRKAAGLIRKWLMVNGKKY